jgi:glycosyltransferase involved in cell wall biosynthesis
MDVRRRFDSPSASSAQGTEAGSDARRICHINLAAGFRGGERQTELLVRELAARGWKQRLVGRRGGELVRRCAGIPGLEIASVLPDAFSAALAARGCALVHAHEGRAVYSGWLLRRLAGMPFVMTRRLHHAENRSWKRSRAYRSADRVVAISKSIARSVEARYPGMTCPVVPDAHAGMTRSIAPAGRRVLPGPGLVVGHVGELHHGHKGQATIVAAARALETLRPDVRFVLVGKGRDGRRLRSLASGLGNVTFTGFVDNVQDYLAAFDVFVYPSLFEGLGSALLDAMAFGLPIVATEVGGIPEIVEDGVNGLLIPPEDPEALTAAIVRLLDDPGLRAAMSRANRARAAEFSAARMADGYEAIYRSLLDPAPAR